MAGKILVADDEASILHVVTLKLRNAGYEIITAVDGEEAYELCIAESPDMILVDNQMPYMTGLEVCKKLKANGSKIPAIMVTARGFELDGDELAAAGIVALLAKPFSPRELLEKVNFFFEKLNQKAIAG